MKQDYYWTEEEKNIPRLRLKGSFPRTTIAIIRYSNSCKLWTIKIWGTKNNLYAFWPIETKVETKEDAKAFAYALVVMNE